MKIRIGRSAQNRAARARDRTVFRRTGWLFFILCWLVAGPAAAAVQLSFYSKEFGSSFPHAFVLLSGTLDATGEPVNVNYGFTASHVSPAVLLGSVTGEVMSAEPDYVAASDRHFSLTLTDAEYGAVLATVERWRQLEQPSYNLNRRNCVFFVADVAASIGMTADTPKALMKKPRSYTEALMSANRTWLEARGAVLYRLPVEPDGVREAAR